MDTLWPLVAPNDDGIRPAGKPDECFYCARKVGQPHGSTCVVVTRKWRVRFQVELDVDMPHCWQEHDIEFRYNEGTWCADNLVTMLSECDGGDPCLCDRVTAEAVCVLDETPTRELRD